MIKKALNNEKDTDEENLNSINNTFDDKYTSFREAKKNQYK